MVDIRYGRKKILMDDKASFLLSLLRKTALDNNFEIIEANVREGDHVHLLISCSPQHSIPSILKALKGNSARWLYRTFPELRKSLWGGNIWSPSYFVATVGESTETQIKTYIQNQEQKV